MKKLREMSEEEPYKDVQVLVNRSKPELYDELLKNHVKRNEQEIIHHGLSRDERKWYFNKYHEIIFNHSDQSIKYVRFVGVKSSLKITQIDDSVTSITKRLTRDYVRGFDLVIIIGKSREESELERIVEGYGFKYKNFDNIKTLINYLINL